MVSCKSKFPGPLWHQSIPFFSLYYSIQNFSNNAPIIILKDLSHYSQLFLSKTDSSVALLTSTVKLDSSEFEISCIHFANTINLQKGYEIYMKILLNQSKVQLKCIHCFFMGMFHRLKVIETSEIFNLTHEEASSCICMWSLLAFSLVISVWREKVLGPMEIQRTVFVCVYMCAHVSQTPT